MRHVVQFLEFPESKSFMYVDNNTKTKENSQLTLFFFFVFFFLPRYCRSWVHFEPMLETRFWRNTLKSTRNENELEVYSEEVIILEFTPIERLIYAHIGSSGTLLPPLFSSSLPLPIPRLPSPPHLPMSSFSLLLFIDN